MKSDLVLTAESTSRRTYVQDRNPETIHRPEESKPEDLQSKSTLPQYHRRLSLLILISRISKLVSQPLWHRGDEQSAVPGRADRYSPNIMKNLGSY